MIADIIESIRRSGGGTPRLTELGKIKIGNKPAPGAKSPEKHDYFTVTTLNRDAHGRLIPDKALMEHLVDRYGDKIDGRLRQLPVRVLSDDVDDVLQSAFVWYGNRLPGARSDGRTVTFYADPNPPYRRLDRPYEEPWDPERHLKMTVTTAKYGTSPMFKLHSTFNCVIAAEQARWGGVYKFRTTSVITFNQLASSLMHIQSLTNGILMGMPLMLVIRPVTASKGPVYVVHAELRGGDIQQLRDQALTQARYKLEFKREVEQVQRQYRALLTGPGTESGEDAEDVADEFAPDGGAGQAADAPEAPDGYRLLDGANEGDAGEFPPGEQPPDQEMSPGAQQAAQMAGVMDAHDADRPARAARPGELFDGKQPAVDPVKEALSGEWEDVRRILIEAAKVGHQGHGGALVTARRRASAVDRWLARNPGANHDDGMLRDLYDALVRGRVDADGVILPAGGETE